MHKIRQVFRNSFLDVAGYFVAPSKGIHLLNSHLLTTEKDLDSSFFDDQLKTLSKNSKIIPFAEAIELIKKKKICKSFSYCF